MSDVTPADEIRMYAPSYVVDNSEKNDEDHYTGEADPAEGLVNTIAGTDHQTPDQTYIAVDHIRQRQANQDVAHELQFLLNASKRSVSRVIPACSESIFRTVVLNTAIMNGQAIQLCNEHQWRSRVRIWCPLTLLSNAAPNDVGMFAVGTDQAMLLQRSVSQFPPNAAILMASAVFGAPTIVLEINTIRDIWLAPDLDGYRNNAGAAITQIPICVMEDFVA